MAQGDPRKWNMPGWRIEQRYRQGVLIGNWSEERHNFLKSGHRNSSTHREDFTPYPNYKPDVMTRRAAMMQNEGLGSHHIFAHHGNRYSNNMISWYDEHYNKRERDEKNKLPELRHWDSHQLSWVPEKTDYPIQGAPTNFGLKASKDAKWAKLEAAESKGDYCTTYGASYEPHSTGAYIQKHYAAPRTISANLHPLNKINKDLVLRGIPSNVYNPEALYLQNVLPKTVTI
ncbi:cilia- and flagella-associated protein 107-like [Ptychodera flava]|uniref:cilia- and flagella-associated protein 107-like n=1 Tax=Ptychodera flava TaxID=63121 RepID=UPI00396A3E1E